MEAGRGVEVDILAGVENVEAADPKRYRRTENQDAPIERSSNRNPRCRRRHAEAKAKYEVGKRGESLRVGIEEKYSERDRRKQKRETIQSPLGNYQQRGS